MVGRFTGLLHTYEYSCCYMYYAWIMYFRPGTPKSSFATLIVFGLISLGAGVALFSADQIPSSWVKESGTISSYTTDNAGKNGITYCPIVTYKVRSAIYTVTGNNSCGGSIPSVGTPARVAYNPADPAKAKALGGLTNQVAIAICAIIGLGLIIWAPINYQKTKGASGGPASVFTTQWPHVPNQVATTTKEQTSPPPPSPPPADTGNPPG
jgi:Protein of unknown function (DUF3592)